MIFLSIWFLFFNLITMADDAALSLGQLNSTVNRVWPNQKTCGGHSPQDAQAGMVCVAEEKKKIPEGTKFIKISGLRPDELPEGLRDRIPADILRRSKDGRVDVYFALPNDNMGIGMYQAVFGPGGDGDDFGSTHGFKVGTGKDYDGYYVNGEFSSNIYTKKASDFYTDDKGQRRVDQFFTEENILKFIVDNKNKGQATFFEAGAGVINLNREDVRGWLFSSGQQVGYHKLTGAYIPNNISRPGESENGVFFEGAFGKFFEYMHRNGKCILEGEVKVSGVASTIENGSSASVSAKGDVYFQDNPKSNSYAIGAEIESQFHQTDNSPSTNVSVGASVGFKDKYGVKLTAKKTVAGARQNYVDFNNDREVTWTIQANAKFGTKGKSLPQSQSAPQDFSDKSKTNFAKASAQAMQAKQNNALLDEQVGSAVLGNFKFKKPTK